LGTHHEGLGVLEGLGIAILLANRHRNNPKRLIEALGEATQQVQVYLANDLRTDLPNVLNRPENRPTSKKKSG